MNQPHLPEDLEQFETHLRNLMPRKAACSLNSVAQCATETASAKDTGLLAMFRRPVRAAAILLSWTLGAAMGSGVTLLFMSPGVISVPQSDSLAAITQEATSAIGDLSRNMSQHDVSEKVPTNHLIEPGRERSWLANAPLRANAGSLDIFLLESEAPGLGLSRPTSSQGNSAKVLERPNFATAPSVPIVPARVVMAPPVRQHALLRDLLAADKAGF